MYLPMPLRAKITSMTKAPPIRRPMLRPATVMSEKVEGRKAWRSSIRRRDALGLGHRDVVLLQRRDQVGAQEADVDRELGGRQRKRR